MNNQLETITTKQAIITQQCECCHKWVNQENLVWDLEEDRLICQDCYDAHPKWGIWENK